MFFDRQGHCLRTNRTGLSILGCLESFVLGRSLQEIFPEKFHAVIEKSVAEAVSGQQSSFEVEHPSHTGERLCWEAVLVPFIDETGIVSEFAGIFVDVTSYVRTSEMLRESEERYRELIEGAHDMIQSVQSDGHFIFVNRPWRESLGYAPEEIASLTIFDIICKDQIGHCTGLFKRVMEGQPIDNVETVFISKNGTRIYVEGSISVRKAGDRVIATQGIFRNITERRKAEEEIITKASLLDLSADAILLLSLDANFIYFNNALMKMTGYTREELLLRKLHGIEPPEFAERIRSNIAMLLAKGEAVFESAYLCKDGTVLPIEVHAIFTEVAGQKVVMSLVRDISERNRAIEAVHSAEKRFRDLLETIQLVAVILDRDGNIAYCNDYLLTMTGWSREDLLNRSWFDIFIPELQREEVKTVFISTIAKGTFPLHYENPIMTRDGRLRQIVWDNTVLLGPDGEAIGTASIGNDMTDHRRLEEQLRHSQKMQAVGQLAGGVAHDFNNILTAIIGYSHLVITRMKPDNPLRLHVEQILQASDRAATLIQSLLAFSRKQMINPKPHDLYSIVVRLEKFLLRLIRENIEFTQSSDGNVLTVFADDSQIEQVLMNLVTNACDAMPKGGRITIRTEQCRIDQRFNEAKGFGQQATYACLIVSDTGTGMDAQTKERIFEPFYTTKEPGKGTGLGLSMVYGIITQHEGFIDVESEPGQGTTFRVYLPLFQGSVEEERHTHTPETMRGGTETVLMAEDDVTLRKLISTILSNYGYRVIESEDGEDVVRKYGQVGGSVDLLLLDGIMPKKSGRDAYREIQMINPHARALFMTGYSEDIIGEEGLLDPGLNVLLKPLTPSELLKKIREVLDAGR